MNRVLLYIIAMLLPVFSCKNELEFSGSEIKPQLVLHGQVEAGRSAMVNLSHSRFFLSNVEFKSVENANVILWKNGIQLETLKYIGFSVGGGYFGDYILESGDEITITASAPGYDDISCSTKIPFPPPLVTVDTSAIYFQSAPIIDYSVNNCVDEKYNTICRISDPGNESNYYRIEAGIKLIYDNSEHYNWLDIESDDIVLALNPLGVGEGLASQKNPYNIFSDEYFNGNTYDVKFSWSSMTCNDTVPPYKSKLIRRELHISLQEISYDYYMYIKTFLAAEYRLDTPFSEPVLIYSNVKGGIGILSSFATKVHKTVLRLK